MHGRPLVSIFLVVIALVSVGCSKQNDDSADDRKRIKVVGTVFPLAEVARNLGGALVEVEELTTPGAEPHDLEPTTVQTDDLLDADLVVGVGKGFQAGSEEVIAQRSGPSQLVLELPSLVNKMPSSGGTDAHVWLDPQAMMAISDATAQSLSDVDPDHQGVYRANASRFRSELQALDSKYEATLAGCRRHTIVVAHRAFGWLARRYGIKQLSLAGTSPEQEPDPRRLGDLAKQIKQEGITTVFNEPLAPEGVAEALARESGAKVAILDPLEVARVGDKKTKGTKRTYFSVMESNRVALAKALDCGES